MGSDTPMMRQYEEIKQQYPHALLFFRLGDFYEMFGEDAVVAAKELEITLTTRDKGKSEDKIPMCGVPYHALENYLGRLIEKGYKVAICEQVEDPQQAKGIVKREVVRVVSPGTIIETKGLVEKENNFLAAIYPANSLYGLAFADVSTGEFITTRVLTIDQAVGELTRLQPAEVLMPEGLANTLEVCGKLKPIPRHSLFELEQSYFDFEACYQLLTEHFKTQSLDTTGDIQQAAAVCAAGAVLKYLMETQKNSLSHLNALRFFHIDQYLRMDPATRRNLELTRNLQDNSRKGSLLDVLDRTMTAMGGRMLKRWVEQPLTDLEAVNHRLQSTEELVNDVVMRSELRTTLRKVYDIERLLGRISYGSANARDLLALTSSLRLANLVKQSLSKTQSFLLLDLENRLESLEELCELYERALQEEPPFSLREGNLIKQGFNAEVDQLRFAATDGRQWIAQLESKEKERTGIKSLKVGYNKVFGYYLEVTRTNLDLVPADYIRKQTLANCERFITPELKEYENMVIGAHERLIQLEYQLFQGLREAAVPNIPLIQETARALAEIDVLCSLAEVATENDYVRPEVNESLILKLTEARHPVVERDLGVEERFVPNDLFLDTTSQSLNILTGPNMAGKSTYIRMSALIVIMAQMGSFVPARKAEVGLVDQVFARVGASDDLRAGQSTFMVEMQEVANITRHATSRSLVILDEVGRGTSTFDGLSIAQAICEYLVEQIRARTLFATHYHQLVDLAKRFSVIKNYFAAIQEQGEDVVFLRRVIAGATDKSYGIYVARLAGVPEAVIERAKEILTSLEDSRLTIPGTAESEIAATRQCPTEGKTETKVLRKLSELNILELTPIEAMNQLYKLQQELKKCD